MHAHNLLMNVQTPLMQSRTPLIPTWTPLTRNSGKSKIDLFKDSFNRFNKFFCRLMCRICDLNILFFQKVKKFKNNIINKVLNFEILIRLKLYGSRLSLCMPRHDDKISWHISWVQTCISRVHTYISGVRACISSLRMHKQSEWNLKILEIISFFFQLFELLKKNFKSHIVHQNLQKRSIESVFRMSILKCKWSPHMRKWSPADMHKLSPDMRKPSLDIL